MAWNGTAVLQRNSRPPPADLADLRHSRAPPTEMRAARNRAKRHGPMLSRLATPVCGPRGPVAREPRKEGTPVASIRRPWFTTSRRRPVTGRSRLFAQHALRGQRRPVCLRARRSGSEVLTAHAAVRRVAAESRLDPRTAPTAESNRIAAAGGPALGGGSGPIEGGPGARHGKAAGRRRQYGATRGRRRIAGAAGPGHQEFTRSRPRIAVDVTQEGAKVKIPTTLESGQPELHIIPQIRFPPRFNPTWPDQGRWRCGLQRTCRPSW